MRVEELLASKRISKEMYDDYVLFGCSDLGKQWVDRMVLMTFMDEPSPDNCKGTAFAYMDGRRSLLRNIKQLIHDINQMIKEIPDDERNSEPE
jgi:hypothetical protein